MSDTADFTAEAEIEQIFSMEEHGTVLLLKNGIKGIIYKGGFIHGENGPITYSGPQMVTSETTRKGGICLFIDKKAGNQFAVGQTIKISKPIG